MNSDERQLVGEWTLQIGMAAAQTIAACLAAGCPYDLSGEELTLEPPDGPALVQRGPSA
jgi:hypothetical protein